MTPDPGVELRHSLDAAREAWEAAAAHDVIESVRLLAGAPVRLRFAGPALVDQLLAPLDHLPELVPDVAAPVLTVHVWDTDSTGAPVPAFASTDESATPAHSVLDDHRAASVSRTRTMFEGADFSTGDGWFGVRSPGELSHGERGAPFRLLLHWWLARRGFQLAHGGAVGVDGHGVLLVGAGGAGKSSTTLSCVEAGLQYAGDDYCAVACEPEPVVHCLYSTAKVVDADVGRYPSLAPGLTRWRHPTDDKSLFLVHRARPDTVVGQLALGALVVPVRTDDRSTRVARASAGEALQALAPSTVGQLPGRAAQVLAALAAVARAVPAYRLELGTDRATVAPAVRALVEQLAPVEAGA